MLAPASFSRPEPFPLPSVAAFQEGPAGGTNILANIAAETQARSNWCWAAVGVALSPFLGRTMTQMEIATRWYAPAPLGNDVASLWGVVHKIFNITLLKHRREALKDAEATRTRIYASIDAGEPAAVNLLWDASGGHFVCIYGYEPMNGQPALWIFDPTDLDNSTSNRELRPIAEMTRYPEPAGTAGRFGRWAEILFLP